MQEVVAKQEFHGVFEIPCGIGKLKYLDAVADQGSDVNLMPLSVYVRLTKELPSLTHTRLSLAKHSYEYPLGIAEDVLVNIAGFLYPVDFMIVERSDVHMPIILGSPFLATARAQIDYEHNIIQIKKGKKAMNFPTVPRHVRNVSLQMKTEAIPNTLHGNVREKILAWEARIENYKENKIRGCKNEDENFYMDDELANDPIEFKIGDLILLRHLETKAPTEEPSPWWYGPFTIKSLHQDGMVGLTSKRGGAVTANIKRLRHYHPDNDNHIYQGYVIMRDDGVT